MMRRIVAVLGTVLAAVLVITNARADILNVSGTSPEFNNDSLGTCTAPILRTATSSQMVHARVVRLAREDSVFVAFPASPFNVLFVGMPPDTYTVRVWASTAARPTQVGCDTLKLYTLHGRPWKVKSLP